MVRPGRCLQDLAQDLRQYEQRDRGESTQSSRRSEIRTTETTPYQHAMENFSWHLGVFFVNLGITLVFSQIPLIGLVVALPLGLDYQVRAYRAAFG